MENDFFVKLKNIHHIIIEKKVKYSILTQMANRL